MRSINVTSESAPSEVSRFRVPGHQHSYFKLENGDWLVLATPSGASADHGQAVTNLKRMTEECVTLALEEPMQTREKLGIRRSSLLVLIRDPGPLEVLSAEQAWAYSADQFPVPEEAPEGDEAGEELAEGRRTEQEEARGEKTLRQLDEIEKEDDGEPEPEDDEER